MTNREFYNAIINGEMNEEIVTFAQAAVEKLDARNAKRAATPSKVQKENEPIKDAILGVLAAEGVHTASTVGAALEISTSKASALLRQLVADGKVNKTPGVKVDKRKTSVYTLAE